MRSPLAWLDARPEWLVTLAKRRAEKPGARRRAPPPDLPFYWLTKAQSRNDRIAIEQTFRAESGPPGYSLSPAARNACRTRLGQAIPVARGPSRKSRTGEVIHEALWLLDPDRPDQLWLALDAVMPPLLWVPAGTTAASVREALAPYFVEQLPARLELPAIARGFAGNETMLEADHEQLENHFTMTSALDFLSWGSDYDDDPWPEELPDKLHRLALMAKLREFMVQRPTRVRATSYRSFWSRSIVTLERHGDGWFVMQARYRPSRSPEVVRAFNEQLGTGFPEDLPVDVVAALLGTGFVTARSLERALEEPAMAESIPFHLLALGAVQHSDLRMLEILRRHARSESASVRRVVAILADWLRYDLLLHEMCATETDPKLSVELEKMTAFVEPGVVAAPKAAADTGDDDDGLDDEEETIRMVSPRDAEGAP
jgi:hypothetical protein